MVALCPLFTMPVSPRALCLIEEVVCGPFLNSDHGLSVHPAVGAVEIAILGEVQALVGGRACRAVGAYV